MNLDKLHEKLIAAARLEKPGDQVPYAFEKRMVALLASVRPLDPVTFWNRAMWHGAVACAAIALLVNVWSFFPANTQTRTADLSQDLDKAVFAMVNQENDSW